MIIDENNSLRSEIDMILRLREKADAEGNDNCFFDEAIDESEITSWEEKNSAVIPESYKDWLRFTRKCTIDGSTAEFWGPEKFTNIHSRFIPNDWVVIGELIGDGEFVCYSKETGEFLECFEWVIRRRHSSFKGVLEDVIEWLDKPRISHNEIEQTVEKIEKRNSPDKAQAVSYVRSYPTMAARQATEEFMKLSMQGRDDVLLSLPDEQAHRFVDRIRVQAVKLFWNNERKLIENGRCTRDWVFEQIETIMNISETTGMKKKDAKPALDYIGRHMIGVEAHPEYAGEWRNVQALSHEEYYRCLIQSRNGK